MALGGAFNAGDALTDDGFGDDELGLAVFGRLGGFHRFRDGFQVVSIDLAHVPAQGFIHGAGVGKLGAFCGGVQRDVVGVVNEDEVVQFQHGGQGERFAGHPFLQTAVPRETEDVLGEDVHAGLVEPRGGAPGGEGEADGVRNALAERPRGAFHAVRIPEFRVAGRDGALVAEVFEVLNADVES